MRIPCLLSSSCSATPLSVGASRIAMLAIDTGLGVQGAPSCDVRPKCRRCRRRRCRC